MSTNYYVRFSQCKECGRTPEDLHIGKQSAGWVFALRIHPDEGINSLESWKTLFGFATKAGAKIVSSDGEELTPAQMLKIITSPHNYVGRVRQRSYRPGVTQVEGLPDYELVNYEFS